MMCMVTIKRTLKIISFFCGLLCFKNNLYGGLRIDNRADVMVHYQIKFYDEHKKVICGQNGIVAGNTVTHNAALRGNAVMVTYSLSSNDHFNKSDIFVYLDTNQDITVILELHGYAGLISTVQE